MLVRVKARAGDSCGPHHPSSARHKRQRVQSALRFTAVLEYWANRFQQSYILQIDAFADSRFTVIAEFVDHEGF